MVERNVVECNFIKNGWSTPVCKWHITFEDNALKFLHPLTYAELKKFDCSQICYMQLKMPSANADRKCFYLQVIEENEQTPKALKLEFKSQNQNYMKWFVDTFNEMAEANEDKMQKNGLKAKKVLSADTKTTKDSIDTSKRLQENAIPKQQDSDKLGSKQDIAKQEVEEKPRISFSITSPAPKNGSSGSDDLTKPLVDEESCTKNPEHKQSPSLPKAPISSPSLSSSTKTGLQKIGQDSERLESKQDVAKQEGEKKPKIAFPITLPSPKIRTPGSYRLIKPMINKKNGTNHTEHKQSPSLSKTPISSPSSLTKTPSRPRNSELGDKRMTCNKSFNSPSNEEICKRPPTTGRPFQRSIVAQLQSNGTPKMNTLKRYLDNECSPSTSHGPTYRQLVNTKNSCYINSSMQALASCPTIVSRCNQFYHLICSEKNLFNRLCSLTGEIRMKLDVFIRMLQIVQRLSGSNGDDSLSKERLIIFRQKIGKVSETFNNEKQQDAHEFMITLLGFVDDIMTDKLLIDSISEIKLFNPLEWRNSIASLNPLAAIRPVIEEKISCFNCGHKSLHRTQETILSLNIFDDSMEIIHLLKSNFNPTQSPRKCSLCNNDNTLSTKRIALFPQCLILNPMRYQQKEQRDYCKNDRQIVVKHTLNVSSLGSFPPIERDENKNTEISKSKAYTFGVFDYNSKKRLNNENGIICSKPLKVLGGAREMESSSNADDIELLDHVMKNPLYFKLLCDRQEIEEMLSVSNIIYDRNKLKDHIKYLVKEMENESTSKMEKKTLPGNIKRIEMDGNCFYRAISWWLTGSQTYHKKMRKETASYLRNNKSMLEKLCPIENYEEHVNDVEEDGVWATNCEITAIANLLNVNIYTFLESGWICQSPQIGTPTENGAIYLNNTTSHYEPVLSLNSNSASSRAQRARKRRASGNDEDDENESDKKNKKLDESSSKEKETGSTSMACRKQPERGCKNGGEGTYKRQGSDPEEAVDYSLVAAVCHTGNLTDSGHYIAYTKDLYNSNTWLRCSDDEVTFVSPEDAVREASLIGYLLFYDRR